MTDSVHSALGLDKVDIRGKLILIEEQHGSDANFITSSILSNALEKNHGICLVLFHSSFGHYHNVGMKLGYNLNVLKERGQVIIIEPTKTLSNIVDDLDHDSVDTASTDIDKSKRVLSDISGCAKAIERNKHLVYQLFVLLYNECYEMMKGNKSVAIIIDDISHMFDMNFIIQDVWYYVKYLRSLMQYEPTIALCIMTHTYNTNSRSCMPNMMMIGLKHMADLIVTVNSLSMGNAKDISGKVHICWKIDSIRRMHHWAKRITYMYRLLDRQVKLYIPGATILS